jgi:hypothetical protein
MRQAIGWRSPISAISRHSEETMHPIDAITPKTRNVPLSCGEAQMSELSVRRAVELMRLASALSPEIKAALPDGADNVTALAAVLDAAEERLPEIAALLIDGKPETRARCAELTARDMSEIIAHAAELNDFALIFANFRRAAQSLKTRSVPPSR